MFEDEFVDKLEEGEEYKLGVIYEYLSKNNIHLYSSTIRVGMHEQTMCIINKVIERDTNFIQYSRSCGRIHFDSVEGIVFAEIAK